MFFHNRILKSALLACLIVLVSSSVSFGAEAVGILEVETGVVKLRRLGTQRLIRNEDGPVPLEGGDNLHSGPKTRAKVFIDEENERVELYPGTVLTLREVSERGTFFGMQIGKALFGLVKRLAGRRFQVQTPSAVIGVKGTEFILGTDGVGKTLLLTLEGTVGMVNLEFPSLEVLVGPDQASITKSGAPPTPPVEVPPDVRDSIIQDEGLGTFEQVEVEAEAAASNQEEPQAEEEEDEQDEEQSEEQGEEQGEEQSGEEPATDESSETTSESSDEESSDLTAESTTESPAEDLAEVVAAVQEVQEIVETATETLQENCPSPDGCGRLGFGW